MSRSFAITYTSPWCERRPLWPTTPFPRNFKHHNMTITPMGTYNVLIFMWYTVFSLIFEACKQHQCIFLEFTVLYRGEITKIAKCTERRAMFEYVGISTSSCGSPRALIGYKPPFDGNELCADHHWGISGDNSHHFPSDNAKNIQKTTQYNHTLSLSKLVYDNMDSYAAEDRWRFDLPLALQLKKPLQSQWWWLELTKILVEKSTNMDTSGQQQMTTYFQWLEMERNQQEVDAEVKVLESHPTPSRCWWQMNLFSIFGWRPMDP